MSRAPFKHKLRMSLKIWTSPLRRRPILSQSTNQKVKIK